jgi:hypothetical protein
LYLWQFKDSTPPNVPIKFIYFYTLHWLDKLFLPKTIFTFQEKGVATPLTPTIYLKAFRLIPTEVIDFKFVCPSIFHLFGVSSKNYFLNSFFGKVFGPANRATTEESGGRPN